MKIRCIRFFGHNWSKWKVFEVDIVDDDGRDTYKDNWQRRECQICGLTQEVSVNLD